jgi:copper chaperone CopZ
MKEIVLDIPLMFADHHVLKVREILSGLEGVGEIYVSSAWNQAKIAYDEQKVKPAAIKKALAEAGYPVGEGEIPILVEKSPIHRDPRWEVSGVRLTATYETEVSMSGEFRR